MTKSNWYTRPGVVLSLLFFIVVFTAVVVKTPVTGREGDPRLLSTSTDPLGAALLYELGARLGYDMRRNVSPTVRFLPGAVITELDPVEELTPANVHVLLEHVRSGGALLSVLGASTNALADSLHITVDPIGGFIESRLGSVRPCATATVFTRTGLWLGPPTLLGLRVADSTHTTRQTFIFVRGVTSRATLRTPRPAMIGMPFGKGRIVVAGDPDVFRNDALRNCSYGLDVAAVTALRYLSEGDSGSRRTMIFDDFLLLRRTAVSTLDIVQDYLIQTASGRFFFQICAAGLLLLLAAAPRVLPPRKDRPLERRSPLEHVDALARAYSAVDATRTGVLRLVAGLERRVGATWHMSARPQRDVFLTQVSESTPTLTADVELVRHALAETVKTAQFVEVGKAIARIEQSLTHSR